MLSNRLLPPSLSNIERVVLHGLGIVEHVGVDLIASPPPIMFSSELVSEVEADGQRLALEAHVAEVKVRPASEPAWALSSADPTMWSRRRRRVYGPGANCMY